MSASPSCRFGTELGAPRAFRKILFWEGGPFVAGRRLSGIAWLPPVPAERPLQGHKPGLHTYVLMIPLHACPCRCPCSFSSPPSFLFAHVVDFHLTRVANTPQNKRAASEHTHVRVDAALRVAHQQGSESQCEDAHRAHAVASGVSIRALQYRLGAAG